jgi:hypothetical protein
MTPSAEDTKNNGHTGERSPLGDAGLELRTMTVAEKPRH